MIPKKKVKILIANYSRKFYVILEQLNQEREYDIFKLNNATV